MLRLPGILTGSPFPEREARSVCAFPFELRHTFGLPVRAELHASADGRPLAGPRPLKAGVEAV